MNLGSRVGKNPYFYPISKIESIDIDTEDDWEFASNLKGILK
jgi:CMP-N-acetylneuraminic acid synthetase